MRQEFDQEDKPESAGQTILQDEEPDLQRRSRSTARPIIRRTELEGGQSEPVACHRSDSDKEPSKERMEKFSVVLIASVVFAALCLIVIMPFVLRNQKASPARAVVTKELSVSDVLPSVILELRKTRELSVTHVDLELACSLRVISKPDGSVEHRWVVIDEKSDVGAEKVQKLKLRVPIDIGQPDDLGQHRRHPAESNTSLRR